MIKKAVLNLTILTLTHAEDLQTHTPTTTEIIEVIVGIILLITAIAIFVTHHCQRKVVVEFESFDASNPTPAPINKEGHELPTYSTEVMK